MNKATCYKLFFIINPGAGAGRRDWHALIENYFASRGHTIELFDLTSLRYIEEIKQKIKESKPQRVIAVGGDGTVSLAAECLLQTNIPLGIIQAGSANGMAKELGIPESAEDALGVVVNGAIKKIHLTKINNQTCVHLSDIGFNASVIKKFGIGHRRGMWGYVKASWQVLWNEPLMNLEIQTDGYALKRDAAMVVLANATRYATGAIINPNGKLDDQLFEVIVVRKISFKEIFKMMVSHAPYNPSKTEVFQTSFLHIHSGKKVYFQVDGEYLGKVDDIVAAIMPDALDVIIPETDINSFS